MSEEKILLKLQAVNNAEKELAAALNEAFPVGSVVKFPYGNGCITGEIIRPAHNGEIGYRNIRTGRNNSTPVYKGRMPVVIKQAEGKEGLQ